MPPANDAGRYHWEARKLANRKDAYGAPERLQRRTFRTSADYERRSPHNQGTPAAQNIHERQTRIAAHQTAVKAGGVEGFSLLVRA